MSSRARTYDVAVIGGGHAGCEVALLAARSGLRTCMLTLTVENIAHMPCNPSIGGPGKGHLVREIDALGGEMGRNADETYLQVRYLNTRKGPSARSLRAQSDKNQYKRRMREVVLATAGLQVLQETAAEVLLEGGAVAGLRTLEGGAIACRAVVVTSGTFLNGRIHVGRRSFPAGRQGEKPAIDLPESLRGLGYRLQRLKTGTPPRIRKGSIDTSAMEIQEGVEPQPKFSYLSGDASRRQYPCHLTHTTQETHRIIRDNIGCSPLYSGAIEGVGPRYCPSVEDKVVKFPEKASHPIYIEPESLESEELYVQGFSTCMPEEVQEAMLRSLPGLRDAVMLRPGYAVEYDALDPTQLLPTLESRRHPGLFFAGQINGTSGYEEAAGQALLAGLNAVALVRGDGPFLLGRDEAYIGVMVDDLTAKGAAEPYRIFTSRSEYRLLLRHDNADRRLTGRVAGMPHISEERRVLYRRKQTAINQELVRLGAWIARPSPELGRALESFGSAPLPSSRTGLELLRRPELTYEQLGVLGYDVDRSLPRDVVEEVALEVKYAGYIRKQERHLEEFRRLEELSLPPDMDYTAVPALSREARLKLQEIKPISVGQASRVSGVRMSDVSLLIGWVKRHEPGVTARGGDRRK